MPTFCMKPLLSAPTLALDLVFCHLSMCSMYYACHTKLMLLGGLLLVVFMTQVLVTPQKPQHSCRFVIPTIFSTQKVPTPFLLHVCYAQYMYTLDIIPLSISSTLGAEDSSHYSLLFISTLVILF